MNKLIAKIVIVVGLTATIGGVLVGCSSISTPTGMCGWVVGDGQGGNDAKIHDTVYPDQSVNVSTNEEAHYIPCGPRNFVVNDGSIKDTGDQTVPIEAMTKEHTPVLIQVSAFWTVNQSALTQFSEICNKYSCYANDAEASAQGENSATPGWNKLLKENFGPALAKAVKLDMPEISDDIWKRDDPAEQKKLEDLLSKTFNEAARTYTGYSADLFCGSGNSGWDNPKTPGKGKYSCTNVRFDVTDVAAKNAQTQENATSSNQVKLDTEANQSRYDKSVPLYGGQTNFWLGVQDAAKSCQKGATCNFYMGNTPTK
jgi:hypothetical protein